MSNRVAERRRVVAGEGRNGVQSGRGPGYVQVGVRASAARRGRARAGPGREDDLVVRRRILWSFSGWKGGGRLVLPPLDCTRSFTIAWTRNAVRNFPAPPAEIPHAAWCHQIGPQKPQDSVPSRFLQAGAVLAPRYREETESAEQPFFRSC